MRSNDPRPYYNFSFVWNCLCASFKNIYFQSKPSKNVDLHIRGLKKRREYPSALSESEEIDSSVAIKNRVCMFSVTTSYPLPRGALVRAWHHSPWSGDHRQVALCSFAVINVTDGAWQRSLISAYSPTHLNQLYRKQRPPVLEKRWWAALRSTKFSEQRRFAHLPLQRGLQFANGSSPPQSLHDSSFSSNPYPVIVEVDVPPVMRSPCEGFTGGRWNDLTTPPEWF